MCMTFSNLFAITHQRLLRNKFILWFGLNLQDVTNI
jgi:hypothetical protein